MAPTGPINGLIDILHEDGRYLLTYVYKRQTMHDQTSEKTNVYRLGLNLETKKKLYKNNRGGELITARNFQANIRCICTCFDSCHLQRNRFTEIPSFLQ